MRLIITSDLPEYLLVRAIVIELILYYSRDAKTRDAKTPATLQEYLDAAKELWEDGDRVTPYRSEDGPWVELDGTNNHKLDILGNGRYAFRDRYNVPAKRQWIEKALKELGVEVCYE